MAKPDNVTEQQHANALARIRKVESDVEKIKQALATNLNVVIADDEEEA
jgi:hypothetical protein